MEKLTEWMNAERGRRKKLADACGITHGAISQWTRVPPDRVLIVENLTGIARTDLRPDLYGELPEAAA